MVPTIFFTVIYDLLLFFLLRSRKDTATDLMAVICHSRTEKKTGLS